jgi:hypothetical protein
MRDTIQGNALRPGQRVGVCGFRGSFTEAEVTAAEPHVNHLGGRWAVVSLRLPDGETVEGVDTRGHVFVGPEYSRTAWCPECRRRVEVEDASGESAYEGRHEVGYYVERLECGHENSTRTGIVGPSPGGESAAEAIAQEQTRRRLDRAAAGHDLYGF